MCRVALVPFGAAFRCRKAQHDVTSCILLYKLAITIFKHHLQSPKWEFMKHISQQNLFSACCLLSIKVTSNS
ncbi:hypothetical protein BsWGS_14396 [Bradybaena similaris]